MDTLEFAASVIVARAPEDLYAMVSDITRMGEWSPVCKACWWDEGESARVDAWFTGRNELPDRQWETRSKVVVADAGREFAFVVNGVNTRWGYTFTPVEGGTLVTESWALLPGGVASFEERFGDDAPAQIANRRRTNQEGIAATLAAIKASAEAR